MFDDDFFDGAEEITEMDNKLSLTKYKQCGKMKSKLYKKKAENISHHKYSSFIEQDNGYGCFEF